MKKIYVFLIASVMCLAGNAQIDISTVSFSLGSAQSSQFEDGVMLGVDVCSIFEKTSVSLNYNRFEEVVFFVEPSDKINQIALLYGYHFGNRLGRVHVKTGFSALYAISRSEMIYQEHSLLGPKYYNTKSGWTIGLPLQLRTTLLLGKSFSVGLSFDANLFSKNSYFAQSFVLEIGDTKKKDMK